MLAYQLMALGVGSVVIIAAWLPVTLARKPVSLPIVLVALGAAVFSVPGFSPIDPRDHIEMTLHLTEAGVLVALLGAGLSIDRPIGLRRWATTWRLLSVGMIGCIVAMGALGMLALGLDPASALLLAAVLAPTDPVLASDVQVGEPVLDERHQNDEDDVRFSLTSEAGLNDGLAFPFVYAAIAAAGASRLDWVGEWIAVDLVYRVVAGIVVGWLFGRGLGRLMFDPPGRLPPIAASAQGFVALGTTMVAYSLTELVHGYGFLAVFIAALSLRSSRRTDDYHAVLHQFTIEIEQVVSCVLLVLFGGALASGLLAGLGWREVAFGLAAIFVVRPVTAWLSLLRSGVRAPERRAIAFFGIRGVGSIFYLAYASLNGSQATVDRLWAVVAFTILLSIGVHGVTATGTMRRLDRMRRRRGDDSRRTIFHHVAPGPQVHPPARAPEPATYPG